MHTQRPELNQAARPERLDIVVSDGGSTDATCSKVEALIENSADLCGASLRLVHSTPGRGYQQNTGVSAAGSVRYLAFVHADTRLPVDFDERIVEGLGIPGNILGAFHFQFDCLEPNGPPCSWFFRLQMSVVCRWVRRRVTKYELPYGNQCLFTTRQAFLSCGGFPSVRLMEDYILVKKMQQFGHVQMAEGAPAVTSARRWLKHGWLQISVLNTLLIIAYALGVQPNTLADVYYGKAKRPVDRKDE